MFWVDVRSGPAVVGGVREVVVEVGRGWWGWVGGGSGDHEFCLFKGRSSSEYG